MSAPEHPPLCGIWVELDDISGDHPIGDCDCGIDGPRNEGWHGSDGTCPNPYCKDGWVDYDPFTPADRCRHPECLALTTEAEHRATPNSKSTPSDANSLEFDCAVLSPPTPEGGAESGR